MPCLPPRPDRDQLRRQAKALLRAAQNGNVDAVARLHAVSDRLILDSAQLAVARGYGFASWARLNTEVTRREILDAGDVARLKALLAEHPELAVEPMLSWCDHPRGASPLGYVAMLRYDTLRGLWRDVSRTAAMANALLSAGALVDGDPADAETPLMAAASYGDAEVARVLIEAGADLSATASADAGGVPGGTALRHATVFGMANVEQVLLAAGATDLVQAAAAGDVTAQLTAETPHSERVAALRMAAERGRLAVIDQLLSAATPVDAVDADGSTALHGAAYRGRADSVSHLLAHGADPAARATRFGGTPLDWCRHRRQEIGPGHGHDEVEQFLTPVTPSERGIVGGVVVDLDGVRLRPLCAHRPGPAIGVVASGSWKCGFSMTPSVACCK